jgi:hypothetical protein
MNSALILNYIGAPFATIRKYSNENPVYEGILVLLLSSLAISATQGNTTLNEVVGATGLSFIGEVVIIMLWSAVIDFWSPAFKSTHKASTLFSWIGVAHLPLLLAVPLSLLNSAFPVLGDMWGLSHLALALFVAVLQVYTVKVLYKTPLMTSIFICLLPLILIFATLTAVLSFVGVYFS